MTGERYPVLNVFFRRAATPPSTLRLDLISFFPHIFRARKIEVAHCSATGDSVAATPPCTATSSRRKLEVRHPL